MKEKKEIEVFDAELQYPAVKQLIEDPNLLRNIYKILNPNHFNQGWLRQAVGCLIDYYSKYNSVPNYKELKYLMSAKAGGSDDDMDFIIETIDKIKKATDISPAIAVENLTELSKVKYSGAIGKQIVDMAQNGHWDEKKARKLYGDLQKLFDVGSHNETARYDEPNMVKVLSQGSDEIIPTGINGLDEALDGGLPKKEFGIFSARQGAGKTTFGTVVAHNTALAGYKTVQLVFEDEIEDLMRQHIAIEANTNRKNLKNLDDDRVQSEVDYLKSKKSYARLNENLIVWHPENETTVEDIEQFIIEISNRFNFKAEVLIIDYFGCLKHSSNPTKDKTLAEEQAMKKIKRIIAHKYKIAVWVLYQKNRTGASNVSYANYDPLATIAGSYNATMDCSVWIDLYRSKEQKLKNRANLIFVKTRHTEEVENFEEIYYNNGMLQIDCEDRDNDNDNDLEYYDDDTPHFHLKEK